LAYGREISGLGLMSHNLIITQEFDMNQVQLLEKFHSLPSDKQIEVFDFIEFLIARSLFQVKTQKCLAKCLLEMPDVGLDKDFMRVDQLEAVGDVFN
jgi:hypothetical protein